MSEYPEHDKLKKVSAKSQAVGEFLDWLMNEQHAVLADWHQHTDECTCQDDWHDKRSWEGGEECPTCNSWYPRHPHPACGLSERRPNPIHRTIEDWLALYFEIDTGALEREKRAMLEQLRETA